MLDDYEVSETPWLLSSQCMPFPVDHFSCSLIHAHEPFLFPGGSTIGLVLHADAPMLCMYTEDAGSGGKVNGGCRGTFTGDDLLRTMQNQRHGKFNEAVVAGLWYEQHLPHAVAAVVYTTTSYWEWVLGAGLGKPEEAAKAQRVHAALCRYYASEGLSGQVPLLRFDGHSFVDVTPA